LATPSFTLLLFPMRWLSTKWHSGLRFDSFTSQRSTAIGVGRDELSLRRRGSQLLSQDRRPQSKSYARLHRKEVRRCLNSIRKNEKCLHKNVAGKFAEKEPSPVTVQRFAQAEPQRHGALDSKRN
jgi:hypothetical protein